MLREPRDRALTTELRHNAIHMLSGRCSSPLGRRAKSTNLPLCGIRFSLRCLASHKRREARDLYLASYGEPKMHFLPSLGLLAGFARWKHWADTCKAQKYIVNGSISFSPMSFKDEILMRYLESLIESACNTVRRFMDELMSNPSKS